MVCKFALLPSFTNTQATSALRNLPRGERPPQPHLRALCRRLRQRARQAPQPRVIWQAGTNGLPRHQDASAGGEGPIKVPLLRRRPAWRGWGTARPSRSGGTWTNVKKPFFFFPLLFSMELIIIRCRNGHSAALDPSATPSNTVAFEAFLETSIMQDELRLKFSPLEEAAGTFVLPDIDPYLPHGSDDDTAAALAALYRSHCVTQIESIRYMKLKQFLNLSASFYGSLTSPVQRLFCTPTIGSWVQKADWLMYRVSISPPARLTLGNRDPVVAAGTASRPPCRSDGPTKPLRDAAQPSAELLPAVFIPTARQTIPCNALPIHSYTHAQCQRDGARRGQDSGAPA